MQYYATVATERAGYVLYLVTELFLVLNSAQSHPFAITHGPSPSIVHVVGLLITALMHQSKCTCTCMLHTQCNN